METEKVIPISDSISASDALKCKQFFENLKWLTSREAMAYLRLSSVGSLRNLVYRRKIPFTKLGRSLRFDREALDRFLDSSATKYGLPRFSRTPFAILKHKPILLSIGFAFISNPRSIPAFASPNKKAGLKARPKQSRNRLSSKRNVSVNFWKSKARESYSSISSPSGTRISKSSR
jgi:excisionase family DNA binding protein